jgi:DNA-binding MarR family transcriptional regulator
MQESNIKESFQKVKEDIYSLSREFFSLNNEMSSIKDELKLIASFLEDLKLKSSNEQNQLINQLELIKSNNESLKTLNLDIENTQKEMFSIKNQLEVQLKAQKLEILEETKQKIPTQPLQNSTKPPIPTDTPTLPHEIGGLKASFKPVSTGNEGVPTDKPTDTPTDQQTFQHMNLSSIKSRTDSLDNVSEILASLDSLKREVRFKFKRLTPQEMQVFSLLYTLEDQGVIVDYKTLADSLKLTQSSIRDYILKLQKKGIPLTKEKLNNKRILLHISPDLKKIASLQTIIKLRDL